MKRLLLEELPWLPLLGVHREVLTSPDVVWRTPWHGRFRAVDVEIVR